MSIKYKILLPMILFTVLAATGILLTVIFQFYSYVETSMQTAITASSEVAQSYMSEKHSSALMGALAMSGDDTIQQTLEEGDREALLMRASELLSISGVEYAQFTDSSGVVIARTHEPEKYGDSIASRPATKAALAGQNLATYEKGTNIPLAITASCPVYDKSGLLIGTSYVGYRLDTENFVDALKPLTDSEVTIFLGDTRLSTTVVKEDGTRATGTQASDEVAKKVLSGNQHIGEALVLNSQALTHYTPLIASDGGIVGMLFVGKYMQERTDTIISFVFTSVIFLLVILGVVTAIAFFIARRIVGPILKAVHAAEDMAKGDIEINLEVDAKDETKLLADAFNNMIENTRRQARVIEAISQGDLTLSIDSRGEKDVMNNSLNNMVSTNNSVLSQISVAAGQVSSGSDQVAQSAQSLAQGSTEQAAAVEELFSSITEVSEKTRQNAAQAERSSRLNGSILEIAQAGSSQMQNMVEAVREINEASRSISNVIGVIDNIAFQTNILALNAAVEAARAGLHGKGFAVVAEEVRSLASKSAAAAKDTSALIENSMQKAQLGVSIATETAASLDKIVQNIGESSAISKDIAELSGIQSEAMEQIRTGIEQVSSVVQQNSATSEETAAASEEMSSQAELLSSLVSGFKLGNEEAPLSRRRRALPSA